MEDKEYGNVYDIDLKRLMLKQFPGETKVIFMKVVKVVIILMYVNQMKMHGMAATGRMDKKDPLMPGKEFIVKPYKLEKDTEIENKIMQGASLYVPKSLDFVMKALKISIY